MGDSRTPILAADVRAPSGSAVPTLALLLTDTGTTEKTNTVALTIGEMGTIQAGAEPIRIDWGSETAPGVGTTGFYILAGGRFDWLVGAEDAFVSVEAGDGSATYEAWLWTSSGARKA